MLQRLRIGLIQMNCEKGAIAQNLERISGYLVEAQQQGIAVVGFPEMSITGYADPTRYPQAVLRLDSPEMCRFLDLTRGLPATVLAGLIEANPGNHDGQTREIGAVTKPFITQVVARNGKLAGWYRKKTIQDEEELWFSPGETSPIFQHNGLSFGIAICADITTESVFAECARQGARIVFELAAPGLYGERATRNWRSGFEWWQGECRKYLSRFAEKYHDHAACCQPHAREARWSEAHFCWCSS